jgi:hypothetical protein
MIVGPENNVEEVGDEIAILITELINIGKDSGYIGSNKKLGFNEYQENIRSREIGEMLHKAGGLRLMKTAAYRVGMTIGGIEMCRLDTAWHGVGEWQG